MGKRDSEETVQSLGRRLRVLHCIQSLEGGGAERQVAYLANALSERGWEVHISALRLGPNADRIRPGQAVLHQLGANGNYDPRLLRELWRVIKRVVPDVILTWLPQMNIVGGLCATVAGVPWILCERTSGRAYSSGLREWTRRRVAAHASAVVANAEAGAGYWKARAAKRVRVEIIPNILPFSEIEASARKMPGRDNRSEGDPLVVAVGRLVPLRNYDVLIQAWAELVREQRARLSIFGEGPEMPRLRALATRLGVSGAVMFAGYVDDLWQRLAQGAAYVSLSSHEGQPNATLEAAAVGCPLVLSDIPEHRAVFSPGQALFVEPREPAAVAAVLRRMLTDPSGAAELGARAKERAHAIALCESAGQYDRLLREVCRREST